MEDFNNKDKQNFGGYYEFVDDETEQKKEEKKKARAEKSSENKAAVSRIMNSTISVKFLVIALVIMLILSSVVSVFIATSISKNSHKYSHLNSSSSLDSATGSNLTISEIVDKNADSVVEILTETSTMGFGGTQTQSSAGSGVIVNERGYVVTNNHVIEDASSIEVTLHNGNSYSAKVIGSDPDNDIAVIKISASGLTAAELGDSSALQVGDLAVAIGNPLGKLGGTATSGIISSLERRLTIDNKTLTLLQTDAAINPGNSGGGLFDGSGNLIGIVVAKSSGTGVEGLGFAIPINSVADIIDEIIDTGKVSNKPAIGITIYDVTEETANYHNVSTPGVYIREISNPAVKKAGLKAGDRIISINGKAVENSSDFIARVRENKIGDVVKLTFARGEEEKTIEVTLVESTSN